MKSGELAAGDFVGHGARMTVGGERARFGADLEMPPRGQKPSSSKSGIIRFA